MNGPKSLEEAANDAVLELLRHVIQQSQPHSENDAVARALLFFLVRASNTWRSMRTLDKYMPDDYGPMVDAGALLRVMFDAYLQAEYIVIDKAKAAERAQDYFDFEHVERYRQAQRVLSCDNPFADALKNSSARPAGEKRLQEAFDRVCAKYAIPESRKGGSKGSKVRTRPNWYPGTLADIARLTGRSDEYAILLSSFHGCVHSTASAVEKGPVVERKHILHWATTIVARIAWLSVEHNHASLNELDSSLLATLRKPYF